VRTKFFSSIAGATLVLLLTSGCQAAPLDIAPDEAKAFQSRVLTVTTAVADGRYAAAFETLAALETELDAAAAEGTVSFARHQRIDAAMAAVRADIQAAIDAQRKPEPAPVEPAPVEEEEVTPDTETDAEKKAREAEEKAVEDAAKKAEEAKKKAQEEAADDAKKAAKEAKKKAEQDAKNTEDPDDEEGDGEEG
jgi:outer membrane biosynthesis protein TonB